MDELLVTQNDLNELNEALHFIESVANHLCKISEKRYLSLRETVASDRLSAAYEQLVKAQIGLFPELIDDHNENDD